MIKKCGKRSRKTQSCYDKQFFSLAKSKSQIFAFDVLSELEKRDGRINHCHSIAHMIADAYISKDYTKWRTFIESLENPVRCTRGLIHGAIEGLAQYDPSFKMEPEYISKLCYSLHNTIKGSSGEYDCSHGIGHILLVIYENDIAKSVKFCNKLEEDLVFYCHDGLFMETILRDMLISHELAQQLAYTETSIKEQEQICNQQTGLAAKACWRELTLLYVGVGEYTPQKVWNLCQRANNIENRQECYLHSAFLAFNANFLDKDEYSILCEPFFDDDTLYKSCLTRVFYSADLQSEAVLKNVLSFCSVQKGEKKSLCCQETQARVQISISEEKAIEIGKQCDAL